MQHRFNPSFESRRQAEVMQTCRHGPRVSRRKFPLRSDVLPSTAMNGLKASATSSLKAALSLKSAPDPTCLHSSRFIRGSSRTRTFLRDTRAREAQADKFFKECIEIAGAATQENCNVARLRVDTRKWAAARLAPKKYGDHINHDVKGWHQRQLPAPNPHPMQQWEWGIRRALCYTRSS